MRLELEMFHAVGEDVVLNDEIKCMKCGGTQIKKAVPTLRVVSLALEVDICVRNSFFYECNFLIYWWSIFQYLYLPKSFSGGPNLKTKLGNQCKIYLTFKSISLSIESIRA